MENKTSVAEALSQAHAALLEDLWKLEEVACPGSRDGLAEFRAQLDATQAHVSEHFRFEEESGYLDALKKREPRLERAIQQLAEEHHQLAQSLAALIGEARAATSLGDAHRAKTREWIERVRQHEHRENALVQAAFNLDIGTED